MILYVDKNHPSASDATTRANNSASQPWLSFGRPFWGSDDRNNQSATECAQPGDRVIFVASATPYLHSISTGGVEDELIFNPRVNGTLADPIVYEASVTWGVRIAVNNPATQGGNAIGAAGGAITGPGHANEKRYFTYRGFLINAVEHPSDAWPFMARDAGNVRFERCKSVGNPLEIHNNYSGFRIERAHDVYMGNCWGSDFKDLSGGNALNGNLVEIYKAGNVVIEHCYAQDCGIFAYSKAPSYIDAEEGDQTAWAGPVTYRFNHSYRNQQGLAIHRSLVSALQPTLIYQNLFEETEGTVFRFHTFIGDDVPKYVKVINNTAYGALLFEVLTIAPSVDGLGANWGNEVFNNVFVSTSSIEGMVAAGPNAQFVTGRFDCNRNVWGIPRAASGTFFSGATTKSYAAWKADFGYDADSLDTAPTFVNAAGRDFRLAQNGQPALTLGRARHSIGGADDTVISCGAWITGNETIGIESEQVPVPARISGRMVGGGL